MPVPNGRRDGNDSHVSLSFIYLVNCDIMSSHPKKDKGFARCTKCSHRFRWAAYCEGCNAGDKYKPKGYDIDPRQRIIDGFSTEDNNLKQQNNSLQQEIPPTIVSDGNLTDRILQVLMLGFPLHYKEISEILDAKETTVNALLSRLSRIDNIPIIREINSNGRIIRGRYMVDPGLRLELELLDKPLKFHNIRLYPGIPKAIFQQFVWEGSIFTTLIQHLPEISIPRGNGRIWPDSFFGRKVNFVSDGKRFWIEISTGNEPLDIPMLWEFINWVANKFGNDTYKYNWEMAFEPNQDLSMFEIKGGGSVEVNIAGKLYRAYQKWNNDSLGNPVLRVEQGRSESNSVTIIENAKLDRESVSRTLEKYGTLKASLEDNKTQMAEMKNLGEEMKTLLNVITDANSDNWSKTEFLKDVKNLTGYATDLVTLIDIMVGDRKVMMENVTQISLNQKAIIEGQRSLIELLKATGLKPEINNDIKPLEEKDIVIYQ